MEAADMVVTEGTGVEEQEDISKFCFVPIIYIKLFAITWYRELEGNLIMGY